MGRGDKRSKKGKIFRASYGKTRFRKKKLFKLRLKKANQKIKVVPPIIEQKPEVKQDVKPKEIIEVKHEIIQPVIEKPVETIKPPVTPAPAIEPKKVEKPKVKAAGKPEKHEEKPDAKKRGRPKKTK